MTLQDAANLATSLALPGVLLAALFALYQLVEVRRTANLTAFLAVVDYLGENRVREARRTLIGLNGKAIASWTKEEREAADLALRQFNAVAIMIRKHLIPVDFVLPEWGHSLSLCWRSAKPLVTEYRSERGARYWHELESLVLLGDRLV